MRHIYAQKEGRSNIKYISENLVNAVVISFKYQIDKKHGNGRGLGGRSRPYYANVEQEMELDQVILQTLSRAGSPKIPSSTSTHSS